MFPKLKRVSVPRQAPEVSKTATFREGLYGV
jgi:hypothetical protein